MEGKPEVGWDFGRASDTQTMFLFRPYPGAQVAVEVPHAMLRCPHDGAAVVMSLEVMPGSTDIRLGAQCHGRRRTVVTPERMLLEEELEEVARDRVALYTELVRALPAPEAG